MSVVYHAHGGARGRAEGAALHGGRSTTRGAVVARPGGRGCAVRRAGGVLRLCPVAHRGLLHHERALHPVFDVAVLHGDEARTAAASALLVDAAGEVVAVLADRVLPPGAPATRVVRPSWDALFA